MPQHQDFPENLQHKPVYVVPYFNLDPGRAGDTDVQFITLGWSQWDHHQLSAKVVRHTGQRWSRQSEELPLARLIDLTILTALAYKNGGDLVQIEADTFEGQAMPISVAHGSKRDRDEATRVIRDDLTPSRFRKLYDLLHQMYGQEKT